MDVRELVTAHYGAEDHVASVLLAAVAEAGVDVEHLSAEDLAPVDNLHAGGAPATAYLLDQLPIGQGARLLDVGCGIGGPARLAASRGFRVTGVDLTPAFVVAATELTHRVGLDGRADFVCTAGQELPFGPGSFDGAMMIHVGMNIPDKEAVFAQVHRVLTPGAPFGVYEQMRTGAGDLPYPLPWADDERSSFVETVEEYAGHLEAAGFTVHSTEDRAPAIAAAGRPPGGLSPEAVFGPAFVDRIANNMAATRQGLLGSIVLVARA